MTESEEMVDQDFPGKGSIDEDGWLDGQMFIDRSRASQRLANNVARNFYAYLMPNNCARMLQRLKNNIEFDEI